MGAFLFLAGILVACSLLVLVFFRDPTPLDLEIELELEHDRDLDSKTMGTLQTRVGSLAPSGKKDFGMGGAVKEQQEEGEEEISVLNVLPSQPRTQ
jgi:hypothetical protein